MSNFSPLSKFSDKSSQKEPDKEPRIIRVHPFYLVLLFLLIAWALFNTVPNLFPKQEEDLPTSAFMTALKEDRIENTTFKLEDQTLTGSYWKNQQDVGNSSKLLRFKSSYAGQDSLSELMEKHPKTRFTVDVSTNDLIKGVISTLLPTLIILAVVVFFMQQIQSANGQAMDFGRAKAKQIREVRPKTRFSDVAGIDEAVEELKEIRDFLAEPKRFLDMGAKIPRGLLLVGSPGTGKTLLAKAVAGEAGVPYFSISGSDFMELFVGVGASRVRDLFKQAKAASPSIIFIDEIDAVGRQRGAGLGGGHDEREQTLNQLLVEMDGFEENDAVVLIAATNRPDILDPALLRPGRFDRRVTVDSPDVLGREKILQVHASNKPLSPEVNLAKMAQLTPGFTGADLANLLNEAALLSARHNKKEIDPAEMEEAMERLIAGPERRGRVITSNERRTIAFHESGHAMVGHKLAAADPVHKISIISRGQALGYTLQLPGEDRFLETRQAMLDRIATLLGGRVAEEVFCKDITTGASNDLEKATKIARQMVTRYGMSSELGTQVYGEPQHEVFLGKDYADHQDYSPDTAKRIDEEVARIMAEGRRRAHEVIEANKDDLKIMAERLLEKETIEGDEVQELLNGTWSKKKKSPQDSEQPEQIKDSDPLSAEPLTELPSTAASTEADNTPR